MGKRPDSVKLDKILESIKAKPDQLPSEIARKVDISHMAILRALTQLEDRGDLLQENSKGRIRLFKR